jgi:hypothetical protein
VWKIEGKLNGRDRDQAWERGDFYTNYDCDHLEERGRFEDVGACGLILTCIIYILHTRLSIP